MVPDESGLFRRKDTAISKKLKLYCAQERETLRIGRRLGSVLRAGDIVCLRGILGAGKTVLAKGIAWGLGVPVSSVVSPTFVVMREISTKRLPVYHFDFYRLGAADEVAAIGYEEYLYGGGVSLIEWPERLGILSPQDCLHADIAVTGDRSRSITLQASGERSRELLARFVKNSPTERA